MVRKGFTPDHYQESKSPQSTIDTSRINVEDPSTLFAFGDLSDIVTEPTSLAEDVPEFGNGSANELAIEALKPFVERANRQGRNHGRDIIRETGGNRFDAPRPDVQSDTIHPDSLAAWMDGKALGLDKEIEKTNGPLDILNETANRLAAGEPEAVVAISRGRLLHLVTDALRPGATYKVDLGDRTVEKKVDARYRHSLIKNPEKGITFINNLRLRSR